MQMGSSKAPRINGGEGSCSTSVIPEKKMPESVRLRADLPVSRANDFLHRITYAALACCY
jgi:hypothetical protein